MGFPTLTIGHFPNGFPHGLYIFLYLYPGVKDDNQWHIHIYIYAYIYIYIYIYKYIYIYIYIYKYIWLCLKKQQLSISIPTSKRFSSSFPIIFPIEKMANGAKSSVAPPDLHAIAAAVLETTRLQHLGDRLLEMEALCRVVRECIYIYINLFICIYICT